MNLYAFCRSVLVSALDARSNSDYTCPECYATVVLRRAKGRYAYFHHLRKVPLCRQHGKSLAHLHIQLHLKSRIIDLELEKRLGKRIADGVWEAEKIVFEIQCSPITLQEVQERIRDYQTLGYQVVWILHDKRYNQDRLSCAEAYLRSGGISLFTDGYHFYDQEELCTGQTRVSRGSQKQIDVASTQRCTDRVFFQENSQPSKLMASFSCTRRPRTLFQNLWRHVKKSYTMIIYKILDTLSRP